MWTDFHIFTVVFGEKPQKDSTKFAANMLPHFTALNFAKCVYNGAV